MNYLEAVLSMLAGGQVKGLPSTPSRELMSPELQAAAKAKAAERKAKKQHKNLVQFMSQEQGKKRNQP